MSSSTKTALPKDGLRSRKKIATRQAIEKAAKSLFSKHGYEATTLEQIAELANVSPATFFRYFRGKADVLLGEHRALLPALRRAILDRPPGETDFEVARHVILDRTGSGIDFKKTAELARTLSALSLDDVIEMSRRDSIAVWSQALAERRGLEAPDDTCILAARISVDISTNAVTRWLANGRKEKLVVLLEKNFEALQELSEAWTRERRKRRAK